MVAAPPLKRWLIWCAVLWALFIAYGSLLPFEFHSRSLSQIAEVVFGNGPQGAYRSLTDRLVNLLLGVPLGFLLFGALSMRAGLARSLWVGLVTIVVTILLALAVEFGQLFLPDRSASLDDIIAQAAGAGLGAIFWSLVRAPALHMLRLIHGLTPSDAPCAPVLVTAARAALAVYLIALLALNGCFTGAWLSLDQAGAKLRDFHFLPLYNYYSASIFRSVYSAALTLLAYAGLGLLHWFSARPPRRARTGAVICALIAAGVEFCKFFIAHRSPDSTNIFLAGVGGGMAAALWPRVYGLLSGQLFPKSHQDDLAAAPSADRSCQVSRLRLMVGRTLAVVVLSATLVAVIGFPLAPLWFVAALLAYTLALYFYPSLWLFVVPALLPCFDLAPWSGRFFLDEFDYVVLATIAVGWWHSARRRPEVRLPGFLTALLCVLGFSFAISLVIGLVPLQPIDANAFASYFSHYNSLRAVKGYAFLIALLPLILHNLSDRVDVAGRLSAGMLAGLVTVILAALWERALFPGLFDFTSDFRISALFSTMNTGDGPVEAYLVAALPFAFLALIDRRSRAEAVLGLIAFALGSYALVVTFSRGGYLAYAVMLGLIVLGCVKDRVRSHHGEGRTLVAILVAAIIGSGAALLVVEGSFARGRLAQIGADWATRLDHWRAVIDYMDGDWSTMGFGMGLGRYPDTDRRKNWAVQMPSYYSYRRDGQNQLLRLSAGAPAYLEQIVDLAPNTQYRISLDSRGVSAAGSLNVMACERTFFRSYHCRDAGAWPVAMGPQWTKGQKLIDSGPLGRGVWPLRRTVKFILENTSRDSAVDIDNVSVASADGVARLRNGDFSRGHDHWYYSSSDHLRWHVKNIWVQVYFEQGLLGLVSFGIFLLGALMSVAHGAWRGGLMRTVMLASIVAFLCVGLFASPLDAPRLTFLFYLLSVIAAVCAAKPEATVAGTEAGVSYAAAMAAARAVEPGTQSGPARAVADIPHGPWELTALVRVATQVMVGLGIFVVGSWLVLRSPLVPYNLRDLLHPVHPVASLVVFGMYLYWSVGFPVLTVAAMTRLTRGALFLPLLTGLHAGLGWLLLTYGVNFDRILKIVGSPVLGWHWYWEPAGRFVALFTVFSLLAVGPIIAAAGMVYRRRVTPAIMMWGIFSALLAPLLYWVVVTQAATDNLVELMAGGGTPGAAIWLSLFFLFLFAGGTGAAAVLHGKSAKWRWLAVAVAAVSIPLAYMAFALGSESRLEKYGKVFSALQFLLSPNRESYISGPALFLRYLIVHCGIIVLTAAIQYPFFAWLFDRQKDPAD